MSNEIILKTIKANDDAVKLEQEKINKLKEIRIQLLKAYKVNCINCGENSLLSQTGFIQTGYTDMDSDWRPDDFKYCKLNCYKCGYAKNSLPQELIEIWRYTTEKKVFKSVKNDEGRRW